MTTTLVERAAQPRLTSSDGSLAEIFDWARASSLTFVRTGRDGELPSYWAGLQDRPMFYSRDVCHQALAGHLLGLDVENYTMLERFARSATPRRGYYPLWAFLFDGTPAPIDYHDDDDFVRETPAAFEISETALRLARWTGDARYRHDPVFADYHRNLVREFLPRHDVLGIGVAGEAGTGDIFAGSPSYNESSEGAGMQVAGDGIASQWAAMTAIATGVADDRLRGEAAAVAERTRELFETTWWHEPTERFATGISDSRRFTEFAFEPSWFPAVKGLLPAGRRAAAHLRFISDGLAAKPPQNIEAFTYLPEAFLGYDHDAEAMAWIRHLADSRSDYPEVPFLLVQHLAVGLTGLVPDGAGGVATRSHLAEEWVEVENVRVAGSTLSIRHEGPDRSVLTVRDGDPVHWTAHVGDVVERHHVRAGESLAVSA